MKFPALFAGALLTSVAFAPATSNATSFLFAVNTNFIVPVGVTSLTILAVGGGGGGANGHQGGGGSGFVNAGLFFVNPGDVYAVIVGSGGLGAQSSAPGNEIIGLTPGSASSFGNLLTAAGGGVVSSINQGGQNGGSGGGGSCNAGSPGGAGGTGGSNGGACGDGSGGQPFGTGQGDYSALLALFSENTLSAGNGGAGGVSSHSGGGGGGGILVNGLGPQGGDGLASFSAHGGIGYGAGGGAGGYNGGDGDIRYGGGNGARGMVYLEFDNAALATPIPAALPLFATGLAGIGALAWRRKRKRAV